MKARLAEEWAKLEEAKQLRRQHGEDNEDSPEDLEAISKQLEHEMGAVLAKSEQIQDEIDANEERTLQPPIMEKEEIKQYLSRRGSLVSTAPVKIYQPMEQDDLKKQIELLQRQLLDGSREVTSHKEKYDHDLQKAKKKLASQRRKAAILKEEQEKAKEEKVREYFQTIERQVLIDASRNYERSLDPYKRKWKNGESKSLL
jgi:hypothetical protein